MRKNLLFLMLIISTASFAQSPAFNWVTQEGNGTSDKASKIRKASNGDLYVVVQFQTATILGGTTYQQLGASVYGDILICKYNSGGALQWAKQLYSSSGISQNSPIIELDGADNLYVGANFDGTLTFDGTSYAITSGISGFFAAKITNSGNLSWGKILSKHTVSFYPVNMAVRNSGEIIYIGCSEDSVIVNNVKHNFIGSTKMYYMSYLSNGNFNWYTLGEDALIVFNSLRIDANNNLYAVGKFTGSHIFPNNNTVTSNGGSDVFLVKFSTTSLPITCAWAKSFGASNSEDAEGLELDATGNVFVLASLRSSITVGSINVNVQDKSTCLIKFNSSGTCLSANEIMASQNYRPFKGYDLRRDINENFYASGYMDNTITINGDTLTPSGSWDALIIKIANTSYNPIWSKQFGGNGLDDVSAIPSNDNELYCAGRFSGVTTFGNITKTALGSSDPFIAKLSGCDFPAVNVTYNGNTTLCNGQTLTLNTNTLNGATYQWLKNDVVLPNQTGTSLLVAGAGTYSIDLNLGGVCRDTFGFVAVTVSNPNATIQSAQPSVCPGGSLQLYTNLPFSSYNWSNGVSTPTITVSQQGTYSVTITDGSGCLDTATLAIGEYTPPTVPTVLQGANCQLASSVIQNGYSYKWRLNGNIVGNNSAYLDANLYGSGYYTIEVTDPNGCKSSSATPVSIILPPTPTIVNISGILTSSSSTGNQWYFNGSPLASQTSQSLSPTQSGDYYVIVTDGNGCSRQSTTINFTLTGFDNNTNTCFSIYPNPTTGVLVILFYNYTEGNALISCTNLFGQTIFKKQLEVTTGQQTVPIDLTSASKGIYIIELDIKDQSVYQKVSIIE